MIDGSGRRSLPMLGETRGKRSPVTCHLKCDDACSKPAPNTTDNAYFRDIAEAALSRRTLFRGAGVGALTLVVGSQLGGALPAAAETIAGEGPAAASLRRGLGFTPIEPQTFDAGRVHRACRSFLGAGAPLG